MAVAEAAAPVVLPAVAAAANLPLLAEVETAYDQFLAAFDRAMLRACGPVLSAERARDLNLDHHNKVLCVERGGLVFVFNWSIDRSIPGYRFKLPANGKYKLVLDSDAREFGGHGRLDPSVLCEVSEDGELSVYSPSRSAQVFARVRK